MIIFYRFLKNFEKLEMRILKIVITLILVCLIVGLVYNSVWQSQGDSKYKSIAAASILAKTYRDEYMENICIKNWVIPLIL